MSTATRLAVLLVTLAAFLHADEKLANNAIVPAGKLENDFYDWEQRHANVMKVKDGLKPEIVMLGDSITHL